MPVQTEMKLFDFLMTPDGGGSERLVGKYFHNMFVLHIDSKAAFGRGEWDRTGFSGNVDLNGENAGTSNNTGRTKEAI